MAPSAAPLLFPGYFSIEVLTAFDDVSKLCHAVLGRRKSATPMNGGDSVHQHFGGHCQSHCRREHYTVDLDLTL